MLRLAVGEENFESSLAEKEEQRQALYKKKCKEVDLLIDGQISTMTEMYSDWRNGKEKSLAVEVSLFGNQQIERSCDRFFSTILTDTTDNGVLSLLRTVSSHEHQH